MAYSDTLEAHNARLSAAIETAETLPDGGLSCESGILSFTGSGTQTLSVSGELVAACFTKENSSVAATCAAITAGSPIANLANANGSYGTVTYDADSHMITVTVTNSNTLQYHIFTK